MVYSESYFWDINKRRERYAKAYKIHIQMRMQEKLQRTKNTNVNIFGLQNRKVYNRNCGYLMHVECVRIILTCRDDSKAMARKKTY